MDLDFLRGMARGSFLLRRDTPKTLGWRADNLSAACKQAAIVFAIMAAALIAIGLAAACSHAHRGKADFVEAATRLHGFLPAATGGAEFADS